MGVKVLSGNVSLEKIESPVFTWQGSEDKNRELKFSEAYRIEMKNWDRGIEACTYLVNDREFSDLSFMDGETRQELDHGLELRKYSSGEKFILLYSDIPTFDSGDREWDSISHTVVYHDNMGVNLIHCRHGYKTPRIDIYTGLEDYFPGFKRFLGVIGYDFKAEEHENNKQKWSQNTKLIIRLAFRDIIHFDGERYHMRSDDIELPFLNTLVDVCIFSYQQDSAFKEKLKKLYDLYWNADFLMEYEKSPEKHKEIMKPVFDKMKSDLDVFTARPTVDEEDFAICPRRTAVLAMTLAVKDIERLR